MLLWYSFGALLLLSADGGKAPPPHEERQLQILSNLSSILPWRLVAGEEHCEVLEDGCIQTLGFPQNYTANAYCRWNVDLPGFRRELISMDATPGLDVLVYQGLEGQQGLTISGDIGNALQHLEVAGPITWTSDSDSSQDGAGFKVCPRAPCSTFPCVPIELWARRSSYYDLHCAGVTCTEADRETCCAPVCSMPANMTGYTVRLPSCNLDRTMAAVWGNGLTVEDSLCQVVCDGDNIIADGRVHLPNCPLPGGEFALPQCMPVASVTLLPFTFELEDTSICERYGPNCVQTQAYPAAYPAGGFCNFAIPTDYVLDVFYLDVEEYYDHFTVAIVGLNGGSFQRYSASELPAQFRLVEGSTLAWIADAAISRSGFRMCARPLCSTYTCPDGMVFRCDQVYELCEGHLLCTDEVDAAVCCRNATAGENISGSNAASEGCTAATTTTTTTTSTTTLGDGQVLGFAELLLEAEFVDESLIEVLKMALTEAWSTALGLNSTLGYGEAWLYDEPGLVANEMWKIGFQFIDVASEFKAMQEHIDWDSLLKTAAARENSSVNVSVVQMVATTGLARPFLNSEVPFCLDHPDFQNDYLTPCSRWGGRYIDRYGQDTGNLMIDAGVDLDAVLIGAVSWCEVCATTPRATEACCAAAGGVCQAGSFILRGPVFDPAVNTLDQYPKFCAPCAPGQYTDDEDVEACFQCVAGTENPIAGAFSCQDCEPGRFAPVNGTHSCIQCGDGYFQERSGTTACDLCPPSFQSSEDSSECVVCPAGRESYDWGSTECLQCQPGSFKETGEANCSLCAPGTFGQTPGLEECLPCAKGTEAPSNGSTLCTACPTGTFADMPRFATCSPCPPGQFQDLERQSTCKSCESGQYLGSEGGTACAPCPNGTQTAFEGATACTACSAGQFNDAVGQTDCRQCPQGEYTADAGFSICWGCEPGRYNPASGFSECFLCDEGTYSQADGAARCVECEAGRYTGSKASTTCIECAAMFQHLAGSPDYWTTMQPSDYDESIQAVRWVEATAQTNISSCGCRPGTQPVGAIGIDYVNGGSPSDPVGGRGQGCAACGEGLLCLGMGQLRIALEYAWDFEIGVFDCTEAVPNACTGGVPGEHCAIGRRVDSITCAECLPGRVASADGPCYECGGADYVVPSIILACVLVAFCLGYCVYDRASAKRPSLTSLLILIALGQFATIVQQLGVVSSIRVEWQNPLQDLFAFVSTLSFLDVDLLRPSCLVSMDPVRQYTGRVLSVYFAGLFMCLAHGVSQVVQHRHDWRERFPGLFCALGTVVMAFFVSIISTMLGPLQCKQHPNSKRTVSWFPSVLCWDSSRHTTMLAIGITACLLPLAFICLAVWAAKVFPKKLMTGQRRFLTTWAFLFFRYHNEAHWYGPILLTRNALVAVAPTLPSPVLQILFLNTVLIISLQIVIRIMPWRAHFANYLESVTHTALIIVVMVSAFFVDDRPTKTLSAIGFSVIFTMPLGILLMVLIGIVKLFRSSLKPYQFFLCHHKAGAGSFARLLKMRLLQLRSVSRKVFIDTDDLKNLDTLFDMVANDTEILVAIHSQQLLMRPWCAGEVVTAHRHKLIISVVRAHGIERPSSEFIENYEQYVPDTRSLTEQGITLEMIQVALSYFRSLHAIYLVEVISSDEVNELSSALVNKVGQTSSKKLSAKRRDCPSRSVVILCDRQDLEAASTALILMDFLVVIITTEFQAPVHVLGSEEILPSDVAKSALICTNGVWSGFVVQALMTLARNLEASVMPVMSTSQFVFPTASVLGKSAVAQDFSNEDFDLLVAFISAIFTEIAVDFAPSALSATENSLQARARDIGRRLWSQVQPVGNRMGSNRGKLLKLASSDANLDTRSPPGSFGSIGKEKGGKGRKRPSKGAESQLAESGLNEEASEDPGSMPSSQKPQFKASAKDGNENAAQQRWYPDPGNLAESFAVDC